MIRERAGEIENLKLSVSDLTTTNASLRTQMTEQSSCAKNCQVREELKTSKAVISEMAITNTNLRSQLN